MPDFALAGRSRSDRGCDLLVVGGAAADVAAAATAARTGVSAAPGGRHGFCGGGAVAPARGTARCFGYGHAIGHAAVVALRDRVAPADITGEDLRAILNRDGARLD